MSITEPNGGREQQLLRHSRREALLIVVVWALCLAWSTAVAYFWGYDRPLESIRLILGMPDWVFWGIVVPWAGCLLFSGWFCFYFMADDDLGEDRSEGGGHA
jgi:Protein of unknown function (DUF997)